MNENKYKIHLGCVFKYKGIKLWHSGHVKPTGKFWKRYFNKKVRNGLEHKRGNWFEWS